MDSVRGTHDVQRGRGDGGATVYDIRNKALRIWRGDGTWGFPTNMAARPGGGVGGRWRMQGEKLPRQRMPGERKGNTSSLLQRTLISRGCAVRPS